MLTLHVDNKNKDILILSGIPTQGLDDTSLTVELNILLILHNQIKKLYKVYTIIRSRISYIFNAAKIYQFKGKTLTLRMIHF